MSDLFSKPLVTCFVSLSLLSTIMDPASPTTTGKDKSSRAERLTGRLKRLIRVPDRFKSTSKNASASTPALASTQALALPRQHDEMATGHGRQDDSIPSIVQILI